MASIKAFLGELWKLTRFEHALMFVFAVLVAEVIASAGIPPLNTALILSLLVPVFSEMGSFALNDYLDIKTDKLNRKMDRPLVKGTITPGFAKWFSCACLLLSVVLAYFINMPAFIIALIFNALAVIYDWKLKDTPLLGNAYIALTMAIQFIFGSYVISPALGSLNLTLALLGFVAGLAREIVKSVQDVEGDVKARSSRTLPVVIGKDASLGLALVLYFIFIPLSALPFANGLLNGAIPLALVALADCMILLSCHGLVMRRDFGFARNATLAAFALGMLGFLLAALG